MAKKKPQLDTSNMAEHIEYMKRYKQTGSTSTNRKKNYSDFYEKLGLERTATHQQIRSAYKKIALANHPDRNSSKEAALRWEGVPAAYSVLSNPKEREDYDKSLTTRDALEVFYGHHNPAKLNDSTIETIIEGWKGREVELFEMLKQKYEIDPHQGTISEPIKPISPEQKVRIRRDSVTSDGAVAPDTIAGSGSWMNYLSCGALVHRCFSGKYYEVYSQTPGFFHIPGVSHTPGQGAPLNNFPKPTSAQDEVDADNEAESNQEIEGKESINNEPSNNELKPSLLNSKKLSSSIDSPGVKLEPHGEVRIPQRKRGSDESTVVDDSEEEIEGGFVGNNSNFAVAS